MCRPWWRGRVRVTRHAGSMPGGADAAGGTDHAAMGHAEHTPAPAAEPAVDDSAAPAAGDVVAETYELRSVLGEGGMGRVLLVERDGERLAMKFAHWRRGDGAAAQVEPDRATASLDVNTAELQTLRLE